MTRTKLIAGVLAGVLLTGLIAPKLYAEFASVRARVVRTALPADSEQLRVPIRAASAFEKLRTPFAVISRVRNDGVSPIVVRVAMDDRELCVAEIAPAASQRLDCVVSGPWSGAENHTVGFSAGSPRYTVEYLELATHFGALTPGPRDLIVGPEGFSASRPSSLWHVIAVFMLLTLSVWSVGDKRLSRVVSRLHVALTATVACVMALVILSDFVSAYSLLIADTFLERLLFLTALPVFVSAAHSLAIRLNRLSVPPLGRSIGVGLVVGGVFLSFAVRQIVTRYGGNASGLVLVSRDFFEKSPMRDREDLRQTLWVSSGGYDAQFFYFMTFDPFLSAFRNDPKRYAEFIDAPPYRYGRIGFSLLTKLLSGNRPTLYPFTMVALVIGALAVSAALLSSIAQRFGQSAWYGALILLVPGFRRSAEVVLPEPLVVAFFLGACVCLLQQRWLACGALLGMSMLVRETSGGLVLALPVSLALAGKRREAATVAALAFLPIVAWKAFVGWVFWPEFGWEAVMPHPDDVGAPFAGVWRLWITIARGEYYHGAWEMARAGVSYSVLTTVAAALALTVAVKRPSPIAAAALCYAVLTTTFNYDGVWGHVANAERLTIDLFVALALVFAQSSRDRRILPRTFAVFWWVTAWYVFYGAFEASLLRDSVAGWASS